MAYRGIGEGVRVAAGLQPTGLPHDVVEAQPAHGAGQLFAKLRDGDPVRVRETDQAVLDDGAQGVWKIGVGARLQGEHGPVVPTLLRFERLEGSRGLAEAGLTTPASTSVSRVEISNCIAVKCKRVDMLQICITSECMQVW